MDRTINVPDFLRDTLRRWRDTPCQGEIPILRKVRLRGQHGIAVVCGDDRMCCETESYLIKLCGGGALWPITIAGGALDLTSTNSVLAAYEIMLEREVNKFIAAKHIPPDAPIDILALGHVDCGFAFVHNMTPRVQFEALYAAKMTLEGLFHGPRFEVRTGFHMFWEGKHRTYELDVPAALNDLRAADIREAAQASSGNTYHHAWSIFA